MNGKKLTTRRALFFACWILLFASFYVAHWGLTWDRSPVLGGYAMLMVIVLWLGQWVWIAVCRKSEPELARLSTIFLLLVFLMVAWDGPITE
jgi:hypothetical protein